MRRILLLITDLQIGGTPTVVRELALRLTAQDVRVDVACLSRMGPVGEVLRSRGIQVIALNADRPTDVEAILRMRKLIRREQYDTVFSFLIHANVAAAMVRPFFRGVRFLQSIQTTQPNPNWHWRAQRLVQRAAEKIVVPSESVAEVAVKWSHIPRDKIAIIANAVDLYQLPMRPIREIGQPARIGFIGRLDPIKRIPDLIEAVAILGDRVRLDVYGDGAERLNLTHLVANLNLGSRVMFHGAIPSPQDVLQTMDVLILPSEAEGFGLVLIEAMASGVPVVATDAPGIRNVVSNEKTGLLVPIGSPKDLAAAITRILDDASRRDRLTTAARADVEGRFSWDQIIAQYRTLLDLRPNPHPSPPPEY